MTKPNTAQPNEREGKNTNPQDKQNLHQNPNERDKQMPKQSNDKNRNQPSR